MWSNFHFSFSVILCLVQKKWYVQKIPRGGWSGFGTALIWINPNFHENCLDWSKLFSSLSKLYPNRRCSVILPIPLSCTLCHHLCVDHATSQKVTQSLVALFYRILPNQTSYWSLVQILKLKFFQDFEAVVSLTSWIQLSTALTVENQLSTTLTEFILTQATPMSKWSTFRKYCKTVKQ